MNSLSISRYSPSSPSKKTAPYFDPQKIVSANVNFGDYDLQAIWDANEEKINAVLKRAKKEVRDAAVKAFKSGGESPLAKRIELSLRVFQDKDFPKPIFNVEARVIYEEKKDSKVTYPPYVSYQHSYYLGPKNRLEDIKYSGEVLFLWDEDEKPSKALLRKTIDICAK